MAITTHTLEEIVAEAARLTGIDGSNAILLRNGSNAMFQLPGGVIARVARLGRGAVAEREIRVARWLSDHGISVTRPLADMPQPTLVDDRPVTWWHALPPHRPGTPAELGAVLRLVHMLPQPEFELPRYEPFDGIEARIDEASVLDADDHYWLTEHCRRLQHEYARVPPFRPPHLVHGDAWQGNLAVVDHESPILLDFEKVSVGDPAWDLVQIAVDHTDFERINGVEYREFVASYGSNILDWPGYRCVASIQELRWVAFALGKADDPAALPEIRHRIACVRGDVPKPWSWSAF